MISNHTRLHLLAVMALSMAPALASAQIIGDVFGSNPPPTQFTQTPIPPPTLACQPANISVFPACPHGHRCGPGDGGPGMLQLTGQASKGHGVTGTAAASGHPALFSRTVRFSYTVPDVRSFAPSVYSRQLMPLSTQTWIVRASEVPGPLGGGAVTPHSPNRYGVSHSGTTTTERQTSTNGRWLLVGRVAAQAEVRKYFQDVSYGFSCELPVQNL